jgi:hypothetical protein
VLEVAIEYERLADELADQKKRNDPSRRSRSL